MRHSQYTRAATRMAITMPITEVLLSGGMGHAEPLDSAGQGFPGQTGT
jgi:hypothetical protein